MHEMSLAMGLMGQLDELARKHHATRVRRLAIEVGAVSNCVPHLLAQAFEALKEQSPLIAQARLEIRELPVVLSCFDCGKRSELEVFRFVCPHCDSPVVNVLQGEELDLRDVELEIPEDEPEREEEIRR